MSIELDLAISMPFPLHVQLKTEHLAIGLIGDSGAGKTTVLSMIAGLIPARGRLVIEGVTLQDDARGIQLPTHQRHIGYAFQDARLFPHMNVRNNLMFAQRIGWGWGLGRQFETPDSVIEALGLARLLDRNVRHLSGGEKQRVALGRAMLSQPMLMLLDEPLANVDGAQKAETLFYIEKLQKLRPVPMIYVSHDHSEVARMTDESYRLGPQGIAPAPVLTREEL